MRHLARPWLIGLLLPLVVAEVALRALSPSLPSPAPWPTVGIEVKTEAATDLAGEPIDVVFLGSSVSEAAIDPDLLARDHAISAFNAAGPFSTPISMATWLDRSLWALEPDTLVIGLPIWGASGSRASDVLEAGFGELTAFEESESGILRRSELWARRSQLRQAIDLVADSVSASTYTDRGHLTHYYGHVRGRAAPFEGDPFPGFSTDNTAALDLIIDDAATRGVEVVLMLEPGGCPGLVPGCADAESEDAARAAVRSLAQSRDVDFVDGRSFPTSDAIFADNAHFNRLGTEGFTQFIGEQLRSDQRSS